MLKLVESTPEVTEITVQPVAYARDFSSKRAMAAAAANDRRFVDAAVFYAELGNQLGYIPAQVVHRERWLAVARTVNVERFYNAYVHVYVIGEMMKAHPLWIYTARPCVSFRSGNDSFMNHGRLRRIQIKVVGFADISRALFGEWSRPYRCVQAHIAGTHVASHIANGKINREAGFLWPAFQLCFQLLQKFSCFLVQNISALSAATGTLGGDAKPNALAELDFVPLSVSAPH